MAIDECQSAYLENMVTTGVGGKNAIDSGDLTPEALNEALEAQGYGFTGAFDGSTTCKITKDGTADYLGVKVTVNTDKKFTLDLNYATALNDETNFTKQ